MDQSTIASSLSELVSEEEKEVPPFDETLLHLYRSFWVVVQDVDASKADCNRADYQYKVFNTQTSALGRLCRRYHLHRAGKNSLEALNGTTFLYTLKHRWSRKKDGIGQITDGAVIALKHFWNHGSSACKPEKLEQFQTAYRILSQRQPELAKYNDTHLQMRHGERHTFQISEQHTSSICSTSRSSVSRLHARATTGSTTGSDEDQPLSPRAKRHRRTVPSSNLDVSLVKSPVVEIPTTSAITLSEPRTKGWAPMQSHGRALGASTIPRKRLLVEDVEREMKAISDNQINAIMTFLSLHLRLPDKHCSPVTPAPSDLLALLYTRCWGEDWSQTAERLSQTGIREVANDTMALIFAFIFEKVFAPNPPPHSYVACATLQQQEYMSTKAHGLTFELLNVLHPYLSALSHLRRLMCSAPLPIDGSDLTFHSSLAETMTSVLRLKLRLNESDMQPTFFWPRHGDAFDPSQMKSSYSLDYNAPRKRTVAYTIFPGVNLMHADGPDVGCRAEVVPSHMSV